MPRYLACFPITTTKKVNRYTLISFTKLLWKHSPNKNITLRFGITFCNDEKVNKTSILEHKVKQRKTSSRFLMFSWRIFFFHVEHHHLQGFGNSHKDLHAECTCSAFRPFTGVLPHHFQGATIHHFANFDLITESFTFVFKCSAHSIEHNEQDFLRIIFSRPQPF